MARSPDQRERRRRHQIDAAAHKPITTIQMRRRDAGARAEPGPQWRGGAASRPAGRSVRRVPRRRRGPWGRHLTGRQERPCHWPRRIGRGHDVATRKLARITPAPARPWGIGVSPDGKSLYGERPVGRPIVDIATGKVDQKVSTGGSPCGAVWASR
jgi:hypothetical protein